MVFLAVQWGCLRFVIAIFPDHTHYFCILIYFNIVKTLVCKTVMRTAGRGQLMKMLILLLSHLVYFDEFLLLRLSSVYPIILNNCKQQKNVALTIFYETISQNPPK